MIGNILMTVVSICTFFSYLPQIIKLIKTKSSADLSIISWILYVTSSFSYFLYACIASKDAMLIFACTVELIFCLIILSLSIKYRKK